MDRLLIIDDDNMNLMLARKVLSGSFEVETSLSGEVGLERIRINRPDALLLDLHMPGMSGLEVIAALKKNPEYKSIPVIFLTADTEKETEAAIFKAGADDYLSKPLSREVAIQRISRIIEANRLHTNLRGELDRQTSWLVESNERFRNISREIMLTMASAIDAKDNYTKGHSTRVAEYSKEIALRMGKSEQEAEEIYFEGLLHDTGKIGIPDNIISKPGRLTDEEYDIIKTHAEIGSKILDNIHELPSLSISAHWHHERYDGLGYPDGLKGNDIPEVARIIAVADTYDAMSSNRSYRRTLTQAEVRAEIERCSGTQFDPRIAAIMLAMIDEDVDYRMRETDIS